MWKEKMKSNYIISGFLVLIVSLFSCKREKAMKMNDPHNINCVSNYQRTFSDLNDKHLQAARLLGIPPQTLRDGVDAHKKGLVEVEPNQYFHVDSLTHSIPYLVPTAYNLLELIGSCFQDSLVSKGLNLNKIVVTSVLRTHRDIHNLRKKNSNASSNSAHTYGTTFDVAYTRFVKVEDPDGYPTQDVGKDTLKMVLGEVMRDLQKEGKCYVKYEVKQGCFHITAR